MNNSISLLFFSVRIDRVIPVSVKFMFLYFHFFQLSIWYFDSFWISFGVQLTTDFQPFFCFRGSNQVHDGGAVDKWFSSPVLCDERKHAMFDLVPFTCPGREVANRDSQSRSI